MFPVRTATDKLSVPDEHGRGCGVERRTVEIPQAGRTVLAGGEQLPATQAESGIDNAAEMVKGRRPWLRWLTEIGLRQAVVGQQPHPGRAVATGGDEVMAVGAEGTSIDTTIVLR